MMKRLISICIVACVALTGCVGTDVGNPQEGTSEVQLDAKGYQAAESNALTLPSGLRIDSAWISMSQFEFRSGNGCETPSDVFDQPLLVDVISNETVTPLPMFELPAGDYCRLDAGFIPWDADVPEGAPDAIQGNSILVTGARSDGTEFVVRSDMDASLRLDAQDDSFALTDGPEALIIGFAFDEWFNENTLDAIDAGGQEIVIDTNSNPAIYGQFNAALRRSSGLFRDDNADGALGMSERGRALARGNEEGNAGDNNGQ